MKKSNRCYVFDTNVIVSALLFKQSKPGKAFYTALEQETILISLPVLKELNEVLSRKKFQRYLLQKEKENFLDAVIQETVLIEIIEDISVCRDSEDDKFIELAINGNAECIISGDKDLLELKLFREIPIITPDEFLKMYSNKWIQ